ncbi:MAG TPA: AsmA-like C-terminal domain-containing protein, partial [Elusimicrobiota bacterium]|nr:AsmA-like C-terminal domain-containing protein [Elusimicrobiota bacterium]
LPALLKGTIRFSAIRFWKPRFLLHHHPDGGGTATWDWLGLPGAAQRPDFRGRPQFGPILPVAPKSEVPAVASWQARRGSFEVWDHSHRPATRWIVNSLTGSYEAGAQAGAWTGKTPFLGRRAGLVAHYEAAAGFPVRLQLTDVELAALRRLSPLPAPELNGRTEFTFQARFQPVLSVRADMLPVLVPELGGRRLRAEARLSGSHLQARLQTGTTAAMSLDIQAELPPAAQRIELSVDHYDADIVRRFTGNRWLQALQGPASFTATAAPDADRHWNWYAEGRHFGLAGASFQVSQWSAKADPTGQTVYVAASTPEGGAAEISWWGPAGSDAATLGVDASSVTVRQILEIFGLTKHETAPAGSFDPFGYEPWRIARGSMRATIHARDRFEVQHSDLDWQNGMHLELNGNFEFADSHPQPQARIAGQLQGIPVGPVVRSFFGPASPISGSARTSFSLNFPLAPNWVQALNGSLQLDIHDGVLAMLKTVYRVVSVLNLGNYLRFRFPQITAGGIPFEQVSGPVRFQNGVLSSDNVVLKSPNMNVNAKGSVDIPGKRLNATIRLELFRFLEDILRDVPITHWIFKKPGKIFLPVVVHLSGPWNNIDVD